MLGRGRVWRRAVQLTAASLAVTGAGAMSGCLSRPLQPEDTRTTSTVVEKLSESAVDKIDLLLMIDNSRSMADKQQILVQAVPDLVRGLVNPKCVDPENPEDSTLWTTPAGPLDNCPVMNNVQLKRDFTPVVDIHIGIVSSSLGGHGADACPNDDTVSGACPGGGDNKTNNDMGHLVTRIDPCSGGTVPTYQNKGFLDWDPTGKKNQSPNPPGEANIGAIATTTNPDGTVDTLMPGLVPSLKDLVLGTGQIGCGYEASMESWYRFLIEPDPYTSVTVNSSTFKASPQGVDDMLLAQRKDFLRPDSLLAIIGLTDENDCSIQDTGYAYLAASQNSPFTPGHSFRMFQARKECATNPNDHCCFSCAQNAPADCPAQPGCDTNAVLDVKADDINLRCWDQKRRFGWDLLYPIDRYVTGLTQPLVQNRMGDMVPNPIFSDLDPTDNDSNVRDSSLVFMAYIVGVPWQDIARQDANGKPDLLKGLDSNGKAVGGFKSAGELATPDAKGHTTWDYIIGDPANYVPPLDPLMVESTTARMGTNPITGDPISPPAKTEAGPNSINGHEYTPGTMNGVQVTPDDLQYACIFKLPSARDCTQPGVACDCSDPQNDNPLCADNGASGRTLQTHAKGYPGTRELTLIQKLGSQGIVGSICPAQLDNQGAQDFGYRPAIGSIIDRLKQALSGQCLPRKLNPTTKGEDKGQVQCLILEAKNTGGTHKDDCDNYCNGKTSEMLVARQAVTEDHKPAVAAAQSDPIAKTAGWDCFCEIKQLNNGPVDKNGNDTDPSDDKLTACQNDAADPPLLNGVQVDGWCYVDATTTPPVGNPDIVKNCADTEKHLVRFVGNGNPQPGSTLFITCAGE